ncbi:14969_t:CDS:2, partial [Rhizophagus irregularis]
ERSLGQVRPFLINEHSHVYKKIQHAVERFPPYSRKSKLEIESDKIIRKRTKNWKRPISYYFNTHNINLAAYKVRRRYNLSGIPDYKFGYLKAVRRYGKYQNRLRSPPPPI